jgi:hypothetical protein
LKPLLALLALAAGTARAEDLTITFPFPPAPLTGISCPATQIGCAFAGGSTLDMDFLPLGTVAAPVIPPPPIILPVIPPANTGGQALPPANTPEPDTLVLMASAGFVFGLGYFFGVAYQERLMNKAKQRPRELSFDLQPRDIREMTPETREELLKLIAEHLRNVNTEPRP